MKRDMDLFRKIAFIVEESDHQMYSQEIAIDGYASQEIMYHCDLLNDANLIVATDMGTNELSNALSILRLTNAGHDFVDAARSDTTWNKVKTFVVTTLGGVSLDLLIKYLKKVGADSLGLSGPEATGLSIPEEPEL